MKLTYLGTAAAEGWPAVFCNCEYCLEARKRGGKNIRTRSQAIINEDLLIEFNGDTYQHALTNNLDLSAVKYCFVTHSHIDHFQPTDLVFRCDSCYAHNITEPMMTLYGNDAVIERYKKYRVAVYDEPLPQMVIEELKPFESVRAGNYMVTPLPACHAEDEDALMFIIKEGDKTLLYLHDTGVPEDDVYEYLGKNKIHADLVSYDCTYGALPSGGHHMGLDSIPEVMKKLSDLGITDENTVSVINHFSHNGKLLHEELCEEAKKIGCLTAYDGMVIEF